MAEPHSVLRFPDGSVSRQPLLTTKFQVPPPPRTLVWRDRLIARLDDASARKLTVVTAPAGFGKTTLLTTWIARTQHLTVWVSLDEADNDPARFWEYVIAALQGASHGGGDQALAMLRAPRALRIEAVLTTLIAALAATEEDVVLVLDDYQHITTQAIHGAVALLLDHLPPRVHLVIASRMQPPLPLSRLRVRDQLLELDAADLRFTAEEATAFLLQAAGPHLSHEIAATLWTRTEGWIAALQLAALVLRGCSDSAMFVSTFSGSHRYVADYLTEEVLLRQPEDVQWFLSSTSILDRLSGPLCEAVSGQSGGQALLERLERDNLFVLPLDEERRWYRYHPLFAEALRGRLRQTQPDLVASLHVRAADWFERHGLLDEALPHTLAAHEFARATQIIAQAALPMLDHGRWATLRTWIAALPEGLVRSHAHLTLLEAWVLLLAEDYDAVEPRLRQTEALLRRGAEVADRSTGSFASIREMRGYMAVARAGIALARSDTQRTVRMCQQALGYLSEENWRLRGLAAGYLGSAYWERGDAPSAKRALAQAITANEIGGNVYFAISAMCMLALVEFGEGHFTACVRTCDRILRSTTLPGKEMAHRVL
ncbi:MAG TPA: AAA family ATPase, partial [Ktedonobacterales bacterium]|nr:AAA family ATPase [Ktedonobacterales bacterium]